MNPKTLFLTAALLCVPFVAPALPAEDCSLPWPEAEAAQHLWQLRPPGAALWNLQAVELLACDEKGRRRVRLWFEPPQAWSKLGLIYRQQQERWLSADGRVVEPPAEPFVPLKKSDIETAEAALALKRFAERYAPVEAVANVANGAVSLALRGRASAAPAGERPQLRLVFQNGRRDPVEGYCLPAIDGLPGRRELLRFAEALSDRHPLCRAVWIEARRVENTPAQSNGKNGQTNGCNYPLGDCLEAEFHFHGRLAGPGCPPELELTVDRQLSVSPPP